MIEGSRESRWDLWLKNNFRAVAAIALLAGFVARLWAASGTFLNPDEAQHFLVANRASLSMAYKSSLTLAHPPLLIFVLYFWRFLGNSEFVLRMCPVLASILFCWIFHKWLTLILGDATALLGLIFVSLLPPLVSLSAQIRQYPLLLLFMALAAYLFEWSLREKSALLLALFSISLYLAMLSHYSALFFTAAIGVYALLRFSTRRFPAGMIATWVVGQIGALALFIFLYRTHISKLRGSSVAREATEGWLHRSYFHPGTEHIVLFVIGRTFGVFQFLFGNLAIGDVTGIIFLAGIVVLLKRKKKILASDGPEARQLVVFFLLPFAANCLAALVGMFPYGGTRHSVFLCMFCLAGIGFFLADIFQQNSQRNFVRSLVATLVIIVACAIFAMPHQPYMTRADQSRMQMSHSLTFIRDRVPQKSAVLIDVQTRMLLGYYLCRDQRGSAETPSQDFEMLPCGEHSLVTANVWMFDANNFPAWWEKMIHTYDLKPGNTVWIIQEGWGVDLGPELKAKVQGLGSLQISSFGRNIQIFQLTVGPAFG